MTKKLKLTKIVLETSDGKRVELSIDEAKGLHDQLHELFGDKYIPAAPIIIERDRWPGPWRPYRPMWVSDSTAPERPHGPWFSCTHRMDSGLSMTVHGQPNDP